MGIPHYLTRFKQKNSVYFGQFYFFLIRRKSGTLVRELGRTILVVAKLTGDTCGSDTYTTAKTNYFYLTTWVGEKPTKKKKRNKIKTWSKHKFILRILILLIV